jgi:hypothetical protein
MKYAVCATSTLEYVHPSTTLCTQRYRKTHSIEIMIYLWFIQLLCQQLRLYNVER